MTGRFVSVPRCPRCGRHRIRRSRRVGPLERALSLVYVYPFRCRLCGRRFFAVQWGTRYGGAADDRRELERIPVRLPAVVSTARGRAQGTTVDLSMEGCAIHVAGTFTADDVVQVEIRLAPDTGPVATATAVVRSVGPEMVGVSFQSMPAEDRQRLRRFMRDLLPAAESEVEAWDAAPRRTMALPFWITALLLLTGVLALIALMPGLSLCTWGVDC